MAKKQALRDYTTYPYNPFRIESRHIQISKFRKGDFITTVVVGEREGMVYEKPGEGQDMYDKEDSIRLFHDAIDKIPLLSTAAQKILFYVFRELTNNADEVHLHVATLMDCLGFKNTRSVYDGIVDLLGAQFIARKTGADLFYINPAYFFRNGRANWYKKMQEHDKKKPEGERIHQPSIKGGLKLAEKKQRAEAAKIGSRVMDLSLGDFFTIAGTEYLLFLIEDGKYYGADEIAQGIPALALKKRYSKVFDGSEVIE